MNVENVELGRRLVCPMRDMRTCQPNCAWNVAGTCAASLLAQQAERCGNELFTLVDILGGAEMERFDNGLPEKADDCRE